jgi:hypothetical protein
VNPSRPSVSEYAPYYSRYISLVSETDVLQVLAAQVNEMERIGRSIPGEREQYRYNKDKWSIREVVGHLTDAERVFGYRAFCISRGDRTPLPGFDQNPYVAEARYDTCALADLMEEFTTVRISNLVFLKRLHETEWQRMGTASDNPVSVRALAFMMAGHVRHHLNGLRTSYGVAASP